MRLVHKLQAGSGAVFGLFLLLHLVTTSSAAAGGGGTYDAVLAALRTVYRPALPVELALIAIPAVVHVACAIVQIVHRVRLGAKTHPPLRIRVHRWAGYLLLLVLAGHVIATRIVPAFGEGPTATGAADASYLAYSLLNWPEMMIPYYLLFGAAGAYHLAIGAGIAWQIFSPLRVRAPIVRVATLVLAAVLAAGAVLGVIGLARWAEDAPTARFAEFRALYERYIPWLRPKQM